MLKAFLLGMREFRHDFTWLGLDDRDEISRAYDWGREWAHRLTFRYWETV